MTLKKNKPRILIAGYEIGGQMQLMAETLRRKGFTAMAVSFNSDFRGYRTDKNIPFQKFPVNRFVFTLKAIQQFDVFHFFWGVSLLDCWKFYGLDLPLLKALKKRVVVHFRGSDLINLDYYLSSQVEGSNPAPLSTPIQLRKLEYWQKYADRVLVSTPNLVDIAGQNSLVIPQIVDLMEWQPQEHVAKDHVVRIVHAPTRRGIKGTDIILLAIEQIKAMGLSAELDLIENLKHFEMKHAFEQADIGIDQLLLGWYGKVAVEFMALGKPVVCYIDPKYANFRNDLPVVQATTHTLTQVLADLIRSESLRKKIGQQSIDYVRQYHDANLVVDNLIDLYASL